MVSDIPAGNGKTANLFYSVSIFVNCYFAIPRKEVFTDKKEKQVFLIYNEIQSGAVAKSYMTNGLLIYGEIFAHFLKY